MVYVTIDTDENANKLIKAVLESNQVACVNKIKQGMYSSYKWEGKVVVDEEEMLLIMKTKNECLPGLI